MDSASFLVVQAFVQSSPTAALSHYASLSSPSPRLSLLAARAHLAIAPPRVADARALLSALPADVQASLDGRAVAGLASFLGAKSAEAKEEAVQELDEVLAETGEAGLAAGGEDEFGSTREDEDGRMVRSVVGAVFAMAAEEGKRDEAVEVLREGIELGQDSACLAVLVHLYLSLSRAPAAAALLASPTVKAFTADSLESQLLQARVNLAMGPSDKYQQAWYVFEELRGMVGGRGGEGVSNGAALAQAAQGRWDEAWDVVLAGLESNPNQPTLLANLCTLSLHVGKPAVLPSGEDAFQKLSQLDPTHPYVQDVRAKEGAFEQAAGGFALGVSA